MSRPEPHYLAQSANRDECWTSTTGTGTCSNTQPIARRRVSQIRVEAAPGLRRRLKWQVPDWQVECDKISALVPKTGDCWISADQILADQKLFE